MDVNTTMLEARLAYYEGRINFIEQISKLTIKSKINNEEYEEKPFDELMILSVFLIDGLANEYYSVNEIDVKNQNRMRFTQFLMKFSRDPFFEEVHPKMLINYAESNNKIKPKSREIMHNIEDFLNKFCGQDCMYSIAEFMNQIKSAQLLSEADLKYFEENILPHGTGASYFYQFFRCIVVHKASYNKKDFGDITCRSKKIGSIDHRICLKALINIFRKMKNITMKSGKLFKES